MFFVAVFTIEGWLRPGYGPARMYVSELALGGRGWIQNANFIVFGLLLLVFTRRVAVEFAGEKASRWSISLLATTAVCYLAFGFFVMDAVSTPRDELTFSGILHALLGEVVLVCMPLSCFVFWRRFQRQARWRSLGQWTLGLGIISAIASSVMLVSMNFPAAQQALLEWVGLIQRFSIVPYMAWLFAFALELLRQS